MPALAFRFSAALGHCSDADAQRVEAALRAAHLPTQLSDIAGHPFSARCLIGHMAQDKKAQGGALTFVLARAIGDAFVAKGVDSEALRAFLIAQGATP